MSERAREGEGGETEKERKRAARALSAVRLQFAESVVVVVLGPSTHGQPPPREKR